ncbi:MAG: radical SAM family heme chaperone HemW [Clostridia bacterium]|nr:radical SAM family heme chaperone HemW [Clostridia bacterium]
MRNRSTLGLYLHIPFCRSKCLYCDFCSFPHPSKERLGVYTNALCRDLSDQANTAQTYTVDTVYIGGGTPTVLPIEQLLLILSELHKQYRIAPDAEITVECNPATGSRSYFEALRRGGVNRLSIGLQSTHRKELRALGRLHSFEDFEATLKDARTAGFQNISADVMSGIPHQTTESYLETLKRLCDLAPEHISAYSLIVEENTPFGRMSDRLVLPDEDAAREMYLQGIEFLAHMGYRQYEISNFAKGGFESRHNIKYWNCDPFLGFGPAAYSDFEGYRFGNSRDLEGYLRGEKILEEREKISFEERKNEYVMLRMRMRDGVRFDAYRERFGEGFEEAYGKALSAYIGQGLVTRTEQGYAFTPTGMCVSNGILAEILDFGE